MRGRWLEKLARAVKVLALALGASLPIAAISYVRHFADPNLKFHSAAAHEIAIGFAALALASFFMIARGAYERRGDPELRILALAFLSLALVYAPHGLLTRAADHNLALFLAFGPASRLVFSVHLLAAQFSSRRSPRGGTWWPHALWLLLLDAIIFAAASLRPNLTLMCLKAIEAAALSIFIASIALALKRRAQLISFNLVALALLAEGSLGFLLARPWNHMWWLAHAIFAAGTFVLGYGVSCLLEEGGGASPQGR